MHARSKHELNSFEFPEFPGSYGRTAAPATSSEDPAHEQSLFRLLAAHGEGTEAAGREGWVCLGTSSLKIQIFQFSFNVANIFNIAK